MMIQASHPAPRFLNLHEYEAAARSLLPAAAWQYAAAGSGDGTTVQANRAAFDRGRLLPRVLSVLREVSTAATVLGQEIALPVLVAPSGRRRLYHDAGERATARAARAAGTIYIMSTIATCPIEDVAPEAGPWWFQLYVYRDREITRDLVTRAAVAGRAEILVDGAVRRGTDILNALALGARAVLIGCPIH